MHSKSIKTLSLFLLFLFISLFITSINVNASKLDFSQKLIMLDENGVVECNGKNCLISGNLLYIINNANVVDVEYRNNNNVSEFEINKIMYNKILIIPIKNNYNLVIKDISDGEENILLDINIFELNFDNFVEYGAGKILNNPAFLVIPAMIFSLLIVTTKLLYFKQEVL